jgi:alkylation response protein AidB-like acyl-CoA dehydrogenase
MSSQLSSTLSASPDFDDVIPDNRPPLEPKPDGPPLTLAILRDRVLTLAEELGRGAADRDLRGIFPFDAFQAIRQAGIGSLRVPARLGGPGGTVADVIDSIKTLATGDSNVAHALRPHFNYSESLFLGADSSEQQRRAQQILSGVLFGGASTDHGTAKPGIIVATLSQTERGYRLNGHKYYTTGTPYSDLFYTSALTESGEVARIVIPTNREGVEVLNDWDGMGQRLTGSGGVRFNDVEVLESEFTVAAKRAVGPAGRHASTYRQLILMACQAGSARAVLNEAVAYGKTTRPINYSHADTARGDYFIQREIGKIAAFSYAIDTLIERAARTLDESAAAIVSKNPDVENILTENAIAVAKAQIVLGPLALQAAEAIFNVGGGSATSRKRNFDRHWRNIRTIMSHNPLSYKEKAVGDYLLNGAEPPGGTF